MPCRKKSMSVIKTACVLCIVVATSLNARSQDYQQSAAHQQAQARMRPIGAPRQMDRYRQPTQQRSNVRYQETAFNETGFSSGFSARPTPAATVRPASQVGNSRDVGNGSSVRQVVMLQNGFAPPPMAADAIGTPPLPTPDPNTFLPQAGGSGFVDRALPVAPNNQIASPSDFATRGSLPGVVTGNNVVGNDFVPINQPQLRDSGFATLQNCNCVSAPSAYSAASGFGCGSNQPVVAQTTFNQQVPNGFAPGFTAPPAQIAAPALMPVQPTVQPGLQLQPTVGVFGQTGVGTAAPPRALISLGQQLNPVQVGQGLVGQPVAYVPGQTIRNWIRYFSP